MKWATKIATKKAGVSAEKIATWMMMPLKQASFV